MTGRGVVSFIESNGFLSKKERHNMISILVGYLMTHHGPNLQVGSFEKSAIAQSIVRSFPCLEDPDGVTGYEAYYTKGARGCPATGYLEEHLRYVRKRMKKTEAKPPLAKEQEEDLISDGKMTNELGEKIEWMKKNTEPHHIVQQYMCETFDLRKSWIRDEEHTLPYILTEFPRLLDPVMLKQDFETLHPAAAEKMTSGWKNYSATVIEYGCIMVPTWKQVLGIDTDIETLPADEKNNLALFMLPLIFGSRAKTKSGGRSSLTDCISSFIDTKLEQCHLPSFLNSINPTHRPQPFILSLYATYKLEPSQVFVIFEREAINVDSLLTAVDMCYKLHYIFDLQYQNLCKGVWEFLQTCVYEQGGITLSSNIRAFRAYLKNAKPSVAYIFEDTNCLIIKLQSSFSMKVSLLLFFPLFKNFENRLFHTEHYFV